MNSEKSSEPPEEPLNVSEHHTLSPASPKPIHFPVPSSIPVLEMQMDVGFNQTEIHMSDPAMHNTEVRPDFWRDPNEISLDEEQPQSESKASIGLDGAHINNETSQNPEEVGVPQAGPEDNTASATGSKESAPFVQPLNSTLLQTAASHGVNIDPPNAEGASHVQSDYSLQLPHDHPTAITAIPADDVASHPVQYTTTSGLDAAQAILASLEPQLPEYASSSNVPAVNDMNVLSPDLQGPSLQAHVVPNPNSEHADPEVHMLPNTANNPRAVADTLFRNVASHKESDPQPIHLQSLPTGEHHVIDIGVEGQNRAGATGVLAVDDNSHRHDLASTAAVFQSSPSVGGVAGLRGELATSHEASLLSPLAQPETSTSNQQPIHVTDTVIDSQREAKQAVDEQLTAEDRPWNADTQRKYDRFIEEERKYVSEGRWEQFPAGSRLFVGNLSSEKVTKRDIFHVFHHYGNLAQISIKQAYGFVQFLRAEDCARALDGEQGTQIRDKRIHLEISKPQKSRNQEKNKERRSRSPDHRRGGKSNVDRYVSGENTHGRRRQRSGAHGRSPTPTRYRDRYEDRYRGRSPETYGRNRYRSPSPKRDEDEDLPLPRRAPRDVPDVQILVLDNLEREFIGWVEGAFASKGVHVDVLVLSPRLPEQAVVRRQIVEGVIAVSKLTKRNQDTGKIGLQVFDRSTGANNVRFEEYDNLDPAICVELVLRARQQQKQATSYNNTYSSGQYSNGAGQPPSYGSYGGAAAPYGQQAPPSYPSQGLPPTAQNAAAPAAAQAPPNLQNLISSLDPNGLQNLLSAMNRQGPPGGPAAQLQGYAGNGTTFGNQQAPPPATTAAALQQNPQALAELLQRQQNMSVPAPALQPNYGGGQQTGNAPVNMQDILARLGTYKP